MTHVQKTNFYQFFSIKIVVSANVNWIFEQSLSSTSSSRLIDQIIDAICIYDRATTRQELISRLDSRMLRAVNVWDLLERLLAARGGKV